MSYLLYFLKKNRQIFVTFKIITYLCTRKQEQDEGV